jgi:hypothetical protein
MITSTPERILVAPLHWGMGHATRCIGLIRRLQAQEHAVVLVAPQVLIERICQSVSVQETIPFESEPMRYHAQLPVWLSVMLQGHRLRKAIRKEQAWVLENSSKLGIQRIISDNRYGMYHPQIPSILLTHQIQPRAPFGGTWAQALVQRQMRKLLTPFQHIWVPDEPNNDRLSGPLSEAFPGIPPVEYIERLSRFEGPIAEVKKEPLFVAILSGPDPHYSRFFQRMRNEATSRKLGFLALGWKMPEGAQASEVALNWSDTDFAQVLSKASVVACSAGYSTLCDLMALGLQAEVYPTPGQTEQGFLAQRWKTRH